MHIINVISSSLPMAIVWITSVSIHTQVFVAGCSICLESYAEYKMALAGCFFLCANFFFFLIRYSTHVFFFLYVASLLENDRHVSYEYVFDDVTTCILHSWQLHVWYHLGTSYRLVWEWFYLSVWLKHCFVRKIRASSVNDMCCIEDTVNVLYRGDVLQVVLTAKVSMELQGVTPRVFILPVIEMKSSPWSWYEFYVYRVSASHFLLQNKDSSTCWVCSCVSVCGWVHVCVSLTDWVHQL